MDVLVLKNPVHLQQEIFWHYSDSFPGWILQALFHKSITNNDLCPIGDSCHLKITGNAVSIYKKKDKD